MGCAVPFLCPFHSELRRMTGIFCCGVSRTPHRDSEWREDVTRGASKGWNGSPKAAWLMCFCGMQRGVLDKFEAGISREDLKRKFRRDLDIIKKGTDSITIHIVVISGGTVQICNKKFFSLVGISPFIGGDLPCFFECGGKGSAFRWKNKIKLRVPSLYKCFCCGFFTPVPIS